MEILYLDRKQIDTERWDHCVEKAPNGLIYGHTRFLDHMAGNWGGLVLGDYKAVMPLPNRKKYGIHYIYQPFLTAQGGLFGEEVTASLLSRFLHSIPAKFRLWEFPLNQGNNFVIQDYPLYQRVNFILDLNRDYEMIRTSYRDNIRRNIRKSSQYGNVAKRDINISEVIAIAAANHPSKADFEHFQNLFCEMKEEGRAICYGVYSSRGDLLASAAFLFSHNRAYYLLVGNHPNGRTLGASHALIDTFIRDHAGQPLVLDFEGSDIRNLAFFYSSFGAVEERYTAIRLNRLPWYMKLFKS